MAANYIPVFNEVVDSSLWKEPLHVRVVFVTLLALKDWDHVVRMALHKIANKAQVGDALFLDAMKVLQEPDRLTTIPQEDEGRRIRKVEDGWFIINGDFYQKKMQEVNKRARWAKLKRDQRARLDVINGKPLPGELAHKRGVEAGDVDLQTGQPISPTPNGQPNAEGVV